MFDILVINPGSTSTKVAVYRDETPLFVESMLHNRETLAPFPSVMDQFVLRRAVIQEMLRRRQINLSALSACVGRGGLLPPLSSGAYRVNAAMLDVLRHRPLMEHASNLGALLAEAIATPLGIPAYIYDPVTVDEMEGIARITGLPDIERESRGHMLNMRACALRYARQCGRPYATQTLLVVHMGGGITLSLHRYGRIVDMISDDEGPFAPERAGGLPNFQLAAMATAPEMTYAHMMRKMRTEGGLVAWFGTADACAVEDLIRKGSAQAALVYEAMAYNIAKNIGKLAVVARGKLDAILLTGGVAHSSMLTDWISAQVGFLAPVHILPGENEMEALALGGLRVLRGLEKASDYVEPDESGEEIDGKSSTPFVG